jgi:hypothetical protein
VKLDRRAVIKAGVFSTSALGLAPLPPAMATTDLAIHDSRLSSRPAPLAATTIDLIDERRARWATIRGGLGTARQIEGITAWSDYVMIAHELQRRGFRCVAETPMGRLWRWRMERSR